ncbi:MAG: SDR family oxidoreductase [candidate division KSB1 bacterium]|nr:SDR family oxidoreductase [candidate division KSB1 bacterium]MDZ7302064.1 SDR family oxidoreductase [candidate division KSB1 bacterium]MDZ7311106.1 SDR family oxidoreductase [candidate division KSB1 bacterium]
MRILITGASGFLGGYLVRAAQSSGELIGTYWEHPVDLPGIEWYRMDLTNLVEVAQFVRKIQPKIILHSAALANLDTCEVQKDLAWRTNVDAARMMAAVAREIGSRLVHISTDMVFDGKKGNYSEDDAPLPISYYGHSKKTAEDDVLHTYPDALVVRVALLYGFPLTHGENFSAEIYHRLRAGQKVNVFGDQFRTPIWAGNAAAAIIELAGKHFRGILHLAGSERISRSNFARELARQMGAEMQLLEEISMYEVNWLVPRPQDVSLKIDRARQILQTPLLDCREGIREMLLMAP